MAEVVLIISTKACLLLDIIKACLLLAGRCGSLDTKGCHSEQMLRIHQPGISCGDIYVSVLLVSIE
jgi:hypothetical protein